MRADRGRIGLSSAQASLLESVLYCVEVSGESEQTAVAGYHAVHLVAHSYLGSLWIALDQRKGPPGKPVLLRRIQLSEQTRSEAFQRMACAGRDAMALSHENVLPVLDVLLQADSLALAYEYVEAEPLRALQSWATHRRLAFPVEVSLRLGMDLLRGVRALHGTLLGWPSAPPYGGLSPDSILVSRDGRTRLCDPLVSSCATMLEGMSLNVAKLAYTAPEQAYATAPLAAASDIFTCGVLLWELLAGNRLLTGPRPTVERKLLEHDLPSLRSQLPSGLEVSDRLVALVERCLASDAGRRPQSPEELASELEQCGHAVASLEQVATFVSELAGARFDQRKMTVRAMPSLRVPAGRPSGTLAASNASAGTSASAANGTTATANGNGTTAGTSASAAANSNSNATSISAGRRVPLPATASGSTAAFRSPVSSLGLGAATTPVRDGGSLPGVALPSRHPFARLGLPKAPKLIEVESTPGPAAAAAPGPIAPPLVQAPGAPPIVEAAPVAPAAQLARAAALTVEAAPVARASKATRAAAPPVEAAPVAPPVVEAPVAPPVEAARAAVPTVEAIPVTSASKATRAAAPGLDAKPVAPASKAARAAVSTVDAVPVTPASKAKRAAAAAVAPPRVEAAPTAPRVEAEPVAPAARAARAAVPTVKAVPVAPASKAAPAAAPRVEAEPVAPLPEAAPGPAAVAPPLEAVLLPPRFETAVAAARAAASPVAPRLEALLDEPPAAAPRAAAPARMDSIVVVPPSEPPWAVPAEARAVAAKSEPVVPTPSSVPPLLVPAGTTTMIGLALPPSLLQAAAQFEKERPQPSTPPSSNGGVLVIPPDPDARYSSAPPGPPLPIRSLIPTLRPRPPGSGAPLNTPPPSSGAAPSGRVSGWSQVPSAPSARPRKKRAVFASLLATLTLAGAVATALLLRPSHDLWSATASWAKASYDSIQPPRAAVAQPPPAPARIEAPVDGGAGGSADGGLPPASEDPAPAAVAPAVPPAHPAELGDEQLNQWFARERRIALPDCRQRLGASARQHNGTSPKKSQTQLKTARRWLLRGNTTEAQRLLCSATAHFAGNVAAWQTLAELTLQLGDAAQAKSYIEQALARRPNDSALLGVLGDAQAVLGDLTQSRLLWAKSLRVSADDAASTRRLAQQFARLGERKLHETSYGPALAMYRRAVVLSLGDTTPSRGMGEALRLLGQPDAALAWAERAAARAQR